MRTESFASNKFSIHPDQISEVRHASLYSGIGGFDLAARWRGWTNVFQVEKDPFCRQVLTAHFPDVQRYSDVRNFNARQYATGIDVLSAGFPCQPFSLAGKRKGADDDRYLWPPTIAIVRAIRPRWLVLENVCGLLSILDSELLSEMEVQENRLFREDEDPTERSFLTTQRRIVGIIIEQIRGAGYLLPCLSDGTPILFIVPACAVGAIHRRDRIWIVAYADSNTVSNDQTTLIPYKKRDVEVQGKDRTWQPGEFGATGKNGPFTDTDGQGLEGRQDKTEFRGNWQGAEQYPFGLFKPSHWGAWPSQSAICRRIDGISYGLDKISFSEWRNESIKSYGNAVVPQVVDEIFQIIEKADPLIFPI